MPTRRTHWRTRFFLADRTYRSDLPSKSVELGSTGTLGRPEDSDTSSSSNRVKSQSEETKTNRSNLSGATKLANIASSQPLSCPAGTIGLLVAGHDPHRSSDRCGVRSTSRRCLISRLSDGVSTPRACVVRFRYCGAGGRTRTADLLITNQLLCQLSYTGTEGGAEYTESPGGRPCAGPIRPDAIDGP